MMRRALRILGIGAAGLLGLVVLAIGAVWINAQRQLRLPVDRPVPAVSVARTPERVARGLYLASAISDCIGCHSSNPQATPPLLDGARFGDAEALATVYATNLTPGGRLRDWSDGQIVRAIREGIAADGRPLLIMPSDHYRHLSDDDVAAIVAYLRSQPTVQSDSPPPSLTPLGTALLGLGQVATSVQPPAGAVVAPPPGPTAAHGAYLAEIGGCSACHGRVLDGRDRQPAVPPGPSLRSVKGWTPEQFVRAMRTGETPSGYRLSEAMPWRAYARATDEDLRAFYEYLISLP